MADRPSAGASAIAVDTTRSASVRAWSWAGLPLVCAVFMLAGRTGWPLAAKVLAERSAYALPILMTVVLGLAAARLSERTERRFWLLLSLANAALFACEVLLVAWMLAIDPAGPPRVSWPFQALHLVAAISLVGVMASMTRLSLASSTARIRYAIDVCIIAAVVYVASLALYVRPLMEPAGGTLAHILAGAGYPVAAFMLLTGAVANVAGLKIERWRSWERLVVGALAVYVVGVALWPLWYAGAAEASRNEQRGFLDLIQLSGHYVLMMAAVFRLSEGGRWVLRPSPPTVFARYRWASAAMPAVSLAAVVGAGCTAYLARASHTWSLAYGTIAILLAAMAVTRGAVLSLEHGALFHRSITDPLTGLYNHRFFHDRLAEEVRTAGTLGENVCVLMIDVDDFGRLNSMGGHSAGERAIAELAVRVSSMVSPRDVVARLGGDELGLIVPDAGAQECTVLAQRILDRVAIETGATPGALTLSAGVAAFPEHARTPEELCRLADCALLAAKSRGKNRVVVFEPGRISELCARERLEQLERDARLSSVRALAAAVDARDAVTRYHSQSVSVLVMRLATAAGFDERRVQLLGTAALLHDVGKIGVPDDLLAKPGPLGESDLVRITQHPELGQRILTATEFDEILPWVRAHHERWDGTGYPDGLAGEAIPIEARMLAICDAYDAMTTDRPYRRAMSREAALQQIDHGIGTQFDPVLADLFIRTISADETPGA